MSTENSTETDPTAHWSFETKQVHAGQSPDSATNARALPIYQTTSYTFDDTTHAAALFGLEVPGNIYTRIGNPTTDVVEQRIAALEGGVAALFLSSGQAAETFAILNVASAGDHIVSSPRLYGGTYNLFHYSLPKLGIEVSFVEDPDDLDSWQAAVRPNTKAFFAETISNPQIDVLDTPGVAGVAHANGVPLIVDNTIATPVPDPAVHPGRRHRGALGHQVPGRPRRRDRRASSSTAAPSTGRRAASPASPHPTPATTAWCSPSWDRRRTRSRRACNCCATSVRPLRRSTRSWWPKAWKR